jgi:hypothetical protein
MRAARDHADHAHFADARKWRRETAPLARVHPVDVHAQMLTPLIPLVKEEVGDGERPQRISHSLCLDLKALPAVRLRGQDARNLYPDHAVTSTERIGGRWRAASTHLSPSASAKREPLWVPK